MKTKGFTLVEILSALVILGILSTVLIRISLKKINETKEKGRDTLIKSIELAATEYALENSKDIENFNVNDYAFITLETLTKKGKFTNKLTDPTTKKTLPITDTVYVTRAYNGTIKSVYDIDQKEKTKITLNGSFNIYVNKGETFTDPGVVAVDKYGNNITSTVVTTGSVNTDTVGNYIITYTCNNTSITRNVIVYR